MGSPSPGEEPEQTTQAASYPTASKVREKQRKQQAKEAGQELSVQKKVKTYDNHKDDCGDCLDGLGRDEGDHVGFEEQLATDSDSDSAGDLAPFSHPRWLVGSEAGRLAYLNVDEVQSFSDVYVMLAYQASLDAALRVALVLYLFEDAIPHIEVVA